MALHRAETERRRLGAVPLRSARYPGRAVSHLFWRIAPVLVATQGERYMGVEEFASTLGKKPTGGHWNSGIAILRNNGLIETEPAVGTPGSKRYRAAALFRN